MRVLRKPRTIIFLLVAAICFVYAALTNIWYARLLVFLVAGFIFCLAFEAFGDAVNKKLDVVIAKEQKKAQKKANSDQRIKSKKQSKTQVNTSSAKKEETTIQKLLGGYNSLEEMKVKDRASYDKLSDADKKHLQAQIDYFNSKLS